MRLMAASGLAGMALVGGLTISGVATAQTGGNYCAVASVSSSAIRGPNYATAGAQAGCGSYQTSSADLGNTATAIHRDPVNYTDQEAVSASFGADNGGHGTAGQTTARANLNDASLHGFAQSTASATADTAARWSDQLTFTNTTGVSQYFTIGWRVDGSAALFNTPDFADGVAVSIFSISTEAQAGISDGSLSYTWINGSTNTINGSYNPFGNSANSGRFAQDYQATSLGGIDRLITSTFGVAPGTHLVDVRGELSLRARNASLNFGNTAALLFGTLPTGVSFTSSSGVFSPRAFPVASAVPELSSWLMLIVGFGLVGTGMRMRSRTTPGGSLTWTICRQPSTFTPPHPGQVVCA